MATKAYSSPSSNLDSSEHPSTSIVIVHFGSYSVLDRCLNSIESSTSSLSAIIVVLNDPQERDIEYIKSCHPSVNVLCNKTNIGYAEAANQGIAACNSDYIALLNNDTVVSEDWLTPLLEVMERERDIALVQPKLLSLNDDNFFDSAGASGGFIDHYGFPFCRGRIYEEIEKDKGQYEDTIDIFWASGAALLMRRTAVIDAGGLDPLFFIYHEETDLAWRLHLMGWRVVVCPKSVVRHAGSTSFKSSRSSMRLRLFMMHRNNFLLIIKNYEWHNLVYFLPIRFLLEIVSLPFFLARNPPEVVAMGRSLVSIFRMRRQIAEARKKTQHLRRVPDSQYHHLMIRGILPILFYLGRKRFFNDVIKENGIERRGSEEVESSVSSGILRL